MFDKIRGLFYCGTLSKQTIDAHSMATGVGQGRIVGFCGHREIVFNRTYIGLISDL